MKWKTSISTKKDGEVFVRGEALSTLIEKRTFSEVAFLLLRGTPPNENEVRMFDAMLVACTEHGVEPPSAFMARTAASVGNSVNTSIAAGVLAISEHHGGAIEACAKLFQSTDTAEAIVSNAEETGSRIPGLGHAIYKDTDPRAEQLFDMADTLTVAGLHTKKMRELQGAWEQRTGKHLPINIDGAIAGILSDMDFDWRLGKAFFILGRLPGIIAHTHEEMMNEKPYRRIDPDNVEYTGPAV